MFHTHHISVPDIFLNYNYSQRSSLQLSVDLQTCSAGILGSVFTCELWTWITVTSICLWGRLEIDTDMLQWWQKNAELMWERRADGIYLSTGAFLQDKHWRVPPWRQQDCVFDRSWSHGGLRTHKLKPAFQSWAGLVHMFRLHLLILAPPCEDDEDCPSLSSLPFILEKFTRVFKTYP